MVVVGFVDISKGGFSSLFGVVSEEENEESALGPGDREADPVRLALPDSVG